MVAGPSKGPELSPRKALVQTLRNQSLVSGHDFSRAETSITGQNRDSQRLRARSFL